MNSYHLRIDSPEADAIEGSCCGEKGVILGN